MSTENKARKIYSDVKSGVDVHRTISSAINFASDVTLATMGAKGSLVMIQNEYGYPRFTKDGVSVLKTLAHEDRHIDSVLQVIKEASIASAAKTGDSTTLTLALIKGLWAECGAVDISDMDSEIEKIKEYIKSLSQEVESTEDICNIAKVSANGDEVIANCIKEAYDKTGDIKNTILKIDNTPSVDNSVKIDDGYKIEAGYVSRAYANNAKNECTYDSAKLLLVNSHNLRNFSLFQHVAKETADKDVPLVIVYSGNSTDVLEKLSYHYINNKRHICIVKVQEEGTRKDDTFNDLSKALGIEVVHDGNFNKILQQPSKILADIENFKSNVEETIFTPSNVNAEALEYLREEIDKETNIDIKTMLESRLAKFLAKVATISISGDIYSERSEVLDRLEDSVFAVRTAVRYGFVAGAGSALSSYESDLGTVVQEALSYPMYTLYVNGGIYPDLVKEKGINPFEYGKGVNLYTGLGCDLIDEGIVDATGCILTALENAYSVFKLLRKMRHISIYNEVTE